MDIQPTGIVGIFTDPVHVIHYTSNDEARQEFTAEAHRLAAERERASYCPGHALNGYTHVAACRIRHTAVRARITRSR